MENLVEKPLFDSAHAALVFAFHFSGQQYSRTMLQPVVPPSIGSGKGLIGLDGAAQAGMIRSVLGELPEMHRLILTARIAPHTLLCECRRPCCNKKRPNSEWTEAISWLTDRAMQYLSGSFSHYRVRRSIIEKIFGAKINLQEIATECGVHRNTVGEQNSKLKIWLEGERSKKGNNAPPGAEQVAWIAIDIRLKTTGMVRNEEAA